MPDYYAPQTWFNGPTGGTPVSAARLNHMEAGIDAVDSAVQAVEAAVAAIDASDLEANGSYAAPSTVVMRTRVTADPEPRWVLHAGGLQEWGDGTNPVDTNLYRVGPFELHTDGHFTAGLDLYARTGAATQVKIGQIGSGQSGISFQAGEAGSNLYRYSAGTIKTDGALAAGGVIYALLGASGRVAIGDVGPSSESGVQFGSAGDTNLYRVSAGNLRTDGTLRVTSLLADYVQDVTASRAYINMALSNGIGVINRTNVGAVPLTVQGMASQVGNLTEWLNAVADPLMVVSPTGVMTANEVRANGLNWGSYGAQGVTTGVVGPGATSGIWFQNFEAGSNLYRYGASVLKTDGTIYAAGNLYGQQGSAPQVGLGGMGPSGQAGLLFGSAADTNLYRSAADTLKTDDQFVIATSGNYPLDVTGAYNKIKLSSGWAYHEDFHGHTIIIDYSNSYADRYFSIERDASVIGGGTPLNVLRVDEAGVMTWGALLDTNLYRYGADQLRTDDLFRCASLRVVGNAIIDEGNTGSALYFGIAADTNLYRSAADTLKTDDSLVVGTTLYAQTIEVDGGLYFGGAFDTSLSRNSAAAVRANGYLEAAFDIYARHTGGNQVLIGEAGPSAEAGLRFGAAADTNLYRSSADTLRTDDYFVAAFEIYARFTTAGQVAMGAVGPGGEAGLLFGSATDTGLYRSAADTLKTDDTFIVGGLLSVGSNGMELNPGGWLITRVANGNGFISLGEQSADPSAFADHARLFSRDNGSGKTQFCVRFGTGAVQVLATEP